MIDDTGCGGACVGVHVIAYVDPPQNGFEEKQREEVARCIREHSRWGRLPPLELGKGSNCPIRIC